MTMYIRQLRLHLLPTNSHRHISNLSQSVNNRHINPVNQRRRRDEITIVLANCDGVTGKKSSIENMLVSLDQIYFWRWKPSLTTLFRMVKFSRLTTIPLATIENVAVAVYLWPQKTISSHKHYPITIPTVNFAG